MSAQMKSETKLYIYRMTTDSGVAPCVGNGMLSLAVCKGGQIRKGVPCNTGLRHLIGRLGEYTSRKVYVLGTYHDRFLYLARVTKVKAMEEYFNGISEGRMDDIYDLKKGKLVRNNHLKKQGVHTEPDRIVKDIAGQYVLLSDDYIYLGKDAVYIDVVKEYNAKFQETKTYTGKVADRIIKECRKHKDKSEHEPNEPVLTKCGE